ncbi:MAG: ACT domain-containing protein [Oscillospiraceae bacterium]
MAIKQISIFVENKPGRLAKITSILAEREVDIRALSIADTTDYGILRLIVSDPDKAEKVLKDEKLTVSITQVLGICIPDVPGGFSMAIKALTDSGISVEYAYAFITPDAGKAYVIIRVEDNEAATKVLTESKIKVIDQNEIFS